MGKDQPRVSIGMPVFNGENYLEEAIESILAQTFSDFELIISDNASTDRTREICRMYTARDRRIHYYRNEANLGAAKNYNRVFELSSGEYFKWAAHDDLCAPEFLERCVEVLDLELDTVLCYPSTNLIDAQGETQGKYADGLHLRSSKPHKRFRQFFDTQGLCHAVFGLIRSEALKSTTLIGNYAMSDRVLLAELALYGRFYELPEYLFNRRIHPQISTHANVSDREIAAWFDPRKKDRIPFPRWRRFVEYLKAVKRAPLSWSERARCYMQVGRFVLVAKRWSGMGGELRKAAKLAFNLLLLRCKSEPGNVEG